MNKIGFVGYGSMGSMLVKGLIHSGMVSQESIVITRKNKERLPEIAKVWPDIQLAEDPVPIAMNCKYIFLCMKPAEFYQVLSEIKPLIDPEQHIISITSAILISDIEKMLPCKITKILPTIVSEAGEGITLVCHNGLVNETEAETLELLLGSFSTVSKIDEEAFGFASQLTSSGPGFYAAMLQEFVEAGLRYHTSLTEEDIVSLVAQTVYGTAKLMLDKSMSFKDVITRVAVKGGITEEGVNVMKTALPQVFDEVFEKTMNKRKIVDEKLHNQFGKN